MEVKISFDTEKENLEDLKRLVAALQDLINKREKANSLGNPLAASNIKTPSQIKAETVQVQAQQDPKEYKGTCRVVPYEDMSGTVSKIFSNGRL